MSRARLRKTPDITGARIDQHGKEEEIDQAARYLTLTAPI